jgi:hypothetical protein
MREQGILNARRRYRDCAMAMDVPENLVREHVVAAISDLASGKEHSFGESTGYDLIFEGRRYPPKAVFGLTIFHATGRVVGPYDFKGGEQSTSFRVLRRLGFTIEPKIGRAGAGEDWSEAECRALVDDYFAMFRSELDASVYNKAEHLRALMPDLDGRSKRSIEFKHRNVSAVLDDLGLPYIQGYRPAKHYQTLLSDLVLEKLGTESDLVVSFEQVATALPSVGAASPPTYENVLQSAPLPEPADPIQSRPRRRFVKYDYRLRDESNRALGAAGEEFVVGYERWRLGSAGREDLAAAVRWTARVVGDGGGYDIESFEMDGTPIVIEVKTTNWGKGFPFLISANEVAVSAERPETFRLYRVFDFRSGPKLYVVSGDMSSYFDLVPKLFEARYFRNLPGEEGNDEGEGS